MADSNVSLPLLPAHIEAMKQLADHRAGEVTLDEVERITI